MKYGVWAILLGFIGISFSVIAPMAQAKEMLSFSSLHSSVESVPIDKELEVRIEISEWRDAVYVLFHYRQIRIERSLESNARSQKFKIAYMEFMPDNPGVFNVILPSSKIGEEGIEYYISVMDKQGEQHILFASGGLPQRVLVSYDEPDIEGDATNAVPAKKGIFSKLREEFELMEAESMDPGSIIVTASRRAQKIEKSPSAVTVLTAEDIRQSGAASIAEALRLVPGLHVIQVNGTLPNISIRGLNGQNPNKILTLVDGRSVFVDAFGMTFWEALPITLIDIQRIEIIRGPVSALYGANAFNGVINIITKTPKQAPSFEFDTRQGEFNLNMTSAAAAYQGDSFGARMSAQMGTHDDYDSPARPFFEERFSTQIDEENWKDLRGLRANGRITYDFSEVSHFSLAAGAANGNLVITSGLGDIRVDGLQSFGELDVNLGDFHFQAYYNRIDLDAFIDLFYIDVDSPIFAALISEPLVLADSHGDTYDLEATYRLRIGENASLLAGGQYRSVGLSAERLDNPNVKEEWFSGFAQFEWEPTDAWLFNLAGRADKHPIAGANFSPRLAAVWGMSEDHHLRFAAGRAFRNPSILESGLDITLSDFGTENPADDIRQVGNKNLTAEKVNSVELGYGGKFGPLRLGVESFYNRIEDKIEALEVKNLNQLLFGGESGDEESLGFITNEMEASGVEVEIDLDVTDWLNLYANWSYQDSRMLKEMENCDTDLADADGGECVPGQYNPDYDPKKDKGEQLLDTPHHLMNVKLTAKGSGLTASAWINAGSAAYMGNANMVYSKYSVNQRLGIEEPQLTELAYRKFRLPGFWTLSLLLSYSMFDDALEIGVVGQNLLDQGRHREYPKYYIFPDTTLPGLPAPYNKVIEQGGSEIERLVYGYLTLKL